VDDNSLQNGAVRPVEIVRASVFTSYKKTTDPKSFRAKMYNEMADANYDIHMLESTSNGPEKCVDISLAVEMLHYATVPNAYDVAILLSGDKDFIPAMVRTRQKGRKVGVVSMKTGCNRALHEGSHIKDFDVVWIDDFLDRLLVPLPPDQMGKNAQRVYDRGMLSAFTITKVILDFASQSPYGKVSSRDVGRYLKNLELPGGTSLLDDVKIGQGGLRRFMQDRMPMAFEVTDRTKFQSRDPNDKSYWYVIALYAFLFSSDVRICVFNDCACLFYKLGLQRKMAQRMYYWKKRKEQNSQQKKNPSLKTISQVRLTEVQKKTYSTIRQKCLKRKIYQILRKGDSIFFQVSQRNIPKHLLTILVGQ
jgi:hypothetical protein